MNAIIIGALAAAIVYLIVKKTGADNALDASRKENLEITKQASDLQEKVQILSKYQGVADAEALAASVLNDAERKVGELLENARREAEALRAEAQKVLAGAKAETAAAKAEVLKGVSDLKDKANKAMLDAREEAGRIIEAAKKRAEEIAGEAYAAMANAQQLEKTAKAMQNIIEGYGDQYLVPTFSALDELAEEFGFAEGGQRLANAREHVRQMVKNGTAATCDYVEANRKTTAIHFVLDAFNGKVDTILSGVKHNNLGILEQKIKDAFTIVNTHGQAFRNARISEDYLQARLDELHWAVVVNELKLKDREEQRAIKERIREEERAQREFERAMKEAEKEEEMLRKAMDKVRKDVERATDTQKEKYEAQLLQLEEKLRLAEEKSQRALSMAQQTKSGHVYVISNTGSFGEDVYKIGLTRRLEPLDRIRELGDASVPFEFDVHALVRSDDAPALERDLHKKFVMKQVNKVNPRREFFRVALRDIREEIERMGCQASWTMTAECREYKETIAIERAMKEKAFEEGKWVAEQIKEHDEILSGMHSLEQIEGDAVMS